MHEITVLSGKGGTGKTTVSASLIALSSQCAAVDADVGASNLHLLLNGKQQFCEELHLGKIAVKNQSTCINCGACTSVCVFHAAIDGIDQILCQGCGTCTAACPTGSIFLAERLDGIWKRSSIRSGMLFHAELVPGGENSGRLVSLLRNMGRAFSKTIDSKLMICDGSPGIGCPVISSVCGADEVIFVTLPTLAAFHDLKRITALTNSFGIRGYVCVNCWDTWEELSREIEEFCIESGIQAAGRIRYDPLILELQQQGVTPVDKDIPSSEDFYRLHETLINRRNIT